MMPTLEELLAAADVVTLHVPETPLTQGMMGRQRVRAHEAGGDHSSTPRAGPSSTSRRRRRRWRAARLGGAAFDVFPLEPEGNDQEFLSPLRRFENVILTPHIAGSTLEAQANIGTEVSEKLVRYSDNGSTLSAVNFPEVSLPEHPGSHRLLHIHKNVPGVLSRINGVFSKNRINISGEYLMTNARDRLRRDRRRGQRALEPHRARSRSTRSRAPSARACCSSRRPSATPSAWPGSGRGAVAARR